MLNKWRTVEHLDDGVISCECLSCYGQWNSTTSPERGGWSFCPLCGTKWEGEHKCEEHGHKKYELINKMTEEQRKTQSKTRKQDDVSWERQRRIRSAITGDVLIDWEWFPDFENYPEEIYKDSTPLRKSKFAAYALKQIRQLNASQKPDEFDFIAEYRLALTKPMNSDNLWDYNKRKVVRVLM